jgi:hypothetical protein
MSLIYSFAEWRLRDKLKETGQAVPNGEGTAKFSSYTSIVFADRDYKDI